MADRFFPPVPRFINSDASGVAESWTLTFYESGTTTKKDTYSDNALTTANPNPITMNSAGFPENGGTIIDIFLGAGDYRVILKDADAVTIWDADPVSGSTGTSGTIETKTAAYTIAVDDNGKIILGDVSGGAFTVTLPASATAGAGFQITVKKSEASAIGLTLDGNGSETIDGDASLVFMAKDQGVTVRADGVSSWSVVSGYGFSAGTVRWLKGADVASAAALSLGHDGNYFDITGTTTITSIGTLGVGTLIRLHFDDALTLTHHATDLVLPGAADITTAAGDEAEFIEYASGDWRMTNYIRAAVEPLAYATQAQQEAGTATNVVVSPGRQQYHLSALKSFWIVTLSGSTPSIDAKSFNAASLDDDATGNFGLHPTTPFSSDKYAAVGTAIEVLSNLRNVQVESRAAGACEVVVTNGSTGLDSSFMMLMAGDQ